ncbi:hypothetical protein JHK87_000981 [Glycine soja]|nr:hypothetical protein JHK87_000981 [Glycine soja]
MRVHEDGSRGILLEAPKRGGGLWTALLRLISRRCPILKDLQASNVLEANKFDVVEFQSMTMLVRANICDNFGFKFPLKAACNVEYLRF